jgi:hypothetical protein
MIKKFIKKLQWQDFVLIGIVLLYLFGQLSITHDFQQLPSNLYGGDFYYQMGCIESIRDGGGFFGGCSILDSEPGYFPLYGDLVALFGNMFGLETLTAMIYFSFILILVSLPMFYLILYYFFKDKNISLFGILLFLPFSVFPVFKYTDFTTVLLVPLLFFSVFYFIKNKSMKSAILFGVVYGLSSISHGIAFIAVNLLFFMTFFYCIFSSGLLVEDNGNSKLRVSKSVIVANFRRYILLFVVIFVIGFVIAQLYWFNPIFEYHGEAKLESHKWSTVDFTPFSMQIDFLFGTIKEVFFNFKSLFAILSSMFSLVGLFYLIKKFRSSNSDKPLIYYFIIFTLFVGLVGTFHYFITELLFQNNLVPTHMKKFLFELPIVLLGLYGVKSVLKQLGKYEQFAQYVKYLFLGILVLLLVSQIQGFNEINNNELIQIAKEPMDEMFLDMQTFVKENTEINDVFLSNNELGFMLNGLTGRKLVVTRRSQNSPFLDFDQREADAAVILYGTDDKKREELLKKYNVKYLYWDYLWIQTEYYFNKETFKIEKAYDPFTVMDKVEWRTYFDTYGVPYNQVHDWLDPMSSGEGYEELDLLRVLPMYYNYVQPWQLNLTNNHLEEVWRYERDGSIIANIYQVRY